MNPALSDPRADSVKIAFCQWEFVENNHQLFAIMLKAENQHRRLAQKLDSKGENNVSHYLWNYRKETHLYGFAHVWGCAPAGEGLRRP